MPTIKPPVEDEYNLRRLDDEVIVLDKRNYPPLRVSYYVKAYDYVVTPLHPEGVMCEILSRSI